MKRSALSSFHICGCNKCEERRIMENTKTDIEKKQSRTGTKKRETFLSGVLAGAVGTVVILAAVFGIKTFLSETLPGSGLASSGVSVRSVENKLDVIDELIGQYYLYEDDIDGEELVEGIYAGYAEALGDPYTEYYDKEETQELFESTSGEFGGIGVAMSQDADGAVTVTNIYSDSPAEKAGMQLNDILIGVDGKDIQGEDLDTVVSYVKGERGTEVELTVLRGGAEVNLTVVRDIIEVQTVDSRMLDGNIGYIAVSEFDEVTYGQFETALNELETKNMSGLIIDLRNNPGGNVETVTDMLRLLLPEGPIMSTKDKNGNTEELTCDGAHEFTKPLAVLVNGYSASASEIFSGAVQDYGTGTVVGTTTYGKGVVQQLISLGDGTCLKLTIAEYYTPSGRSINGTGVTPDVEVEYEYDKNNPNADNQLDKAVEVIRQKLQ